MPDFCWKRRENPYNHRRKNILNGSPFFRHLQVEFLEALDGIGRLALKIQSFHLNTQGIVQGGVLSSLADTAALLAIGTKLSFGQRPRTVQMGSIF